MREEVKTDHLLKDIRLDLIHNELRPVYEVFTQYESMSRKRGRKIDFDLIQGGDNLGQALVTRILTPKGELTSLGHPDYGSRVHEIVGSENTETTRNLLKLFIIEAIQREPRVEEIIEVVVEPAIGLRDSVDISLSVKAVGYVDTITIGPFSFSIG